MFAVKGIYDGKTITIEDPVPVTERYAVAVTFLYSVEKEPKNENIEENIKKFRQKQNNLAEHLAKSIAEGKTFDFNAQEIIDGNESEKNRQIRYELERKAWAMSVADNEAKWKA
jgi:hypothetical protein